MQIETRNRRWLRGRNGEFRWARWSI